MAQLVYKNQAIESDQEESVLDVLTRHGHAIPFGCRSGVCQACLMVADEGQPPLTAQQGLTEAQQKLNYFLSCQCVPEQAMTVRLPSAASVQLPGEVIEKTFLTDQVVRLRLKAELNYYPGQYVNLWRDDNLARSYSLASVPGTDEHLEFHIKLAENGQFSEWLKSEVEPGTKIGVQGPMGQCIFSAKSDQPLLLAGIATGLAPLYGILRQALAEGHQMPIHLVLAGKSKNGFYLLDELQELAAKHANLQLHFICQDEQAEFAQKADVYAYCKEHFADLKSWRVFLCGAESFVKKMRKQSFLSGAAMKDISADSFVASAV